MSIRLGCCVGIKATENDPVGIAAITAAAEAGFEYVELPLTSITAMDDDGFDKLLSALSNAGVKCEACNVLMPANIKLTGPNADINAARDYMDRALTRAASLGAEIIVFGSGGARNVDDGFPMEKATEQLADFLRMVSDKLKPYSIRLAIEPLNKKECNIINTFREALELALATDRPNICALADYYHMCLDNDHVETLTLHEGKLIHTHIADFRSKRGFPLDKEAYADFLDALDAAGYKGRLSIEGGTSDFMADAGKSIALFNELRNS